MNICDKLKNKDKYYISRSKYIYDYRVHKAPTKPKKSRFVYLKEYCKAL